MPGIALAVNQEPMAQYFARIVRALIVAFLGFGGGVGLLTMIVVLAMAAPGQNAEALHLGLKAAIVAGLGFGAFLAILLLLTDLTSRLFVARGDYAEIWELVQHREREFTGNLSEVKKYCREALLAVSNIKAVTDNDEYSMTASIGASWKSPGEQMDVNIKQLDENRWLVTCESRCLAANVAFDYAKNFENVETWLKNAKLSQDETKLQQTS